MHGVEPYARSFEPRTRLGEITEAHAGLEPGAKDEDSRYRVAGRVMARREHGKAVFITLRDGWDDLQVYANVDALGEDVLRAAHRPRRGRHHRLRRPRVPHPAGRADRLRRGLDPSDEVPAAAAREVARSAGSGDPLSAALRRSGGQSRGRLAAAGPGQAGLGHAPLSGGSGFRGGGDAHPPAPARRRSGPAVRHPSQCARHRPVPAHRSRALPQAAAGGRIRSHF